jgi:aspartyl protease family protein
MLPHCASCLRKERRKPRIRLIVVAALLVAVGAGGYATYKAYEPRYDYGAVADDVARLERALEKEPCDQQNIALLLEQMLVAGDDRGVIGRAAAFSSKCRDESRVTELTYAAHERLGELDQANAELTRLVETTPRHPYYPVWRARIRERQGNLDGAAEDLQQALVLYPAATDIPLSLATILEKQGKPCDAIAPLEGVVFRYPNEGFVVGVRARLASLDDKGCAKTGGARVTIRDVAGNGSFRTKVVLGEKETAAFVVDTGATYVTLSRKLADRLHLDLSTAPKRELQTANGKRDGLFVILPSIAIEGLSTRRVPAVVIDDLGPGVDGLLGQSFLSRFEMKQARGVMELSARATSTTPSAQ